jgi:uncharacterized protein HemX
MRVSKVLLACAATAMASMPVVASAAAAPSVKNSTTKSVEPSVRESSKSGKAKAGEEGIIILVLAAAAVAAGIYVAVDGDSSPDSP